MLARIRKAQEEGEGGFTLIELLVVMIIIGILAAIAIPVFLNQRKKAQDSAAKADVATIGLLQERAIRQGEVLTEQLQVALNSRVVIEQAKGALAQVHDISPAEAFQLMRAYSRSQRLRLGDVARLVTDDPASIPELTAPDRP